MCGPYVLALLIRRPVYGKDLESRTNTKRRHVLMRLDYVLKI